MSHPTRPTNTAKPAGSTAATAEHPTPPARGQFGRTLRRWAMDHLSIRQRLALWYASLLALTLILFSVVVYTVAQTQFQTSVNSDLQSRAQAIAAAIARNSDISNQLTQPTPSPTTNHATVTATASASPSATLNATPNPTTTAITTTPVATANPQTTKNVATKLNFTIPDLLKKLDTQFEVITPASKGGVQLVYATNSLIAPGFSPATGSSGISSPATGLPLNNYVISEGMQGIPDTYTTTLNSSLLKVYVQPIVIAGSGSSQPSGPTPNAQSTATAAPQRHVIGLVLVTKPLDDINASLSTLARLLVFGDIVAVLFVSLGGWMIAEGSLRPITEVTQTARAIAANAQGKGLGRRVVHHGTRDEVGELATTFNGMLDAIERSANAQRRFVADASHELRAPLMTIKGSLELLRRAPDLAEEDQRATLEDAYAESERMASLINDLLLLARVDAASSGSYGLHEAWLDEQLRGRREVVELDRLAMDVFRHGRAQLEASHKDLRLAVTDLEPVNVIGDPGQLRQYALIVLDNAIKYTPAGGTIRISAAWRDGKARLSISDTGIGIDPADWPHIFERFYRADRARERDEHGSGLGLAIAKWIASAHQGEISVSSEPGKGSTFTLILPALPRSTGQTDPRRALPDTHRRDVASAARHAVAPLARFARSVSRPRPKNAKRSKSTTKQTRIPPSVGGDSTAPRAGQSPASAPSSAGQRDRTPNESGIYRARPDTNGSPQSGRAGKTTGTTTGERTAPPNASQQPNGKSPRAVTPRQQSARRDRSSPRNRP